MTKKQVTSERLDAFFEAVPRFIQPYRDRMLHWLASADRLCGQVAGGGSTYEQQALFVVRLAGIVSDLRRRFKVAFLTPAELAGADFATRHREECRGKVIAAIAALYALLSEDELLWLELRRHEQSHPVLDGYIPEASNDVNWDRFKSTILDGTVLPIDEIVTRCAKLEQERGGFVGVAESIARRVFQHVSAVQLAMIPLMAGFRS
jgi:hypothetical protein